MVKVSIIVPVYNIEMYLEECIESISRQTLRDIEIICVNIGSLDDSLETLKKYAEKDTRFIIVNQENNGYGKAINVGMKQASGEYIGIVEPMDFVPLYMYEDLYQIASENQLDVLKTDFYCFNRDADNGDMQMHYEHIDSSELWYGKIFDSAQKPEALRIETDMRSCIYRRAYLVENSIWYNEAMKNSFHNNGFDFLAFVHAKRVLALKKPYYMARQDNTHSLGNTMEQVYSGNIEYDYIREILMQDEMLWERFKYIYTFKKYNSYNEMLTCIGNGFKKEYIKRYGAELKRAEEKDELNQRYFSKDEWDKLCFIMKDPSGYYTKDFLQSSKERKLRKELNDIKRSTSYKIGKIIMALPIAVKKLFTKAK